MSDFKNFISKKLKRFESALSQNDGALSNDDLQLLTDAVHSITNSRAYKKQLKLEEKEKESLIKEIEKAEKTALKVKGHR